MELETVIGLWAGGLTTFAFLPQLLQAWRTKRTKDISLNMYLIFTTGIILWLIYGLMISSLPIIIANIVSLVFSLSIVLLKLIYK